MLSVNESLAHLELRAARAVQHLRLLRSQKYIHLAWKKQLENCTRTARREHRYECLRLSQHVQRLRALCDELSVPPPQMNFDWYTIAIAFVDSWSICIRRFLSRLLQPNSLITVVLIEFSASVV